MSVNFQNSTRNYHSSPIIRDEHAVARRVAARLHAGPYYSLKKITCEFHEGVLTLRGRVPSFYLKQVAQEIATKIEQVEMLLNHLEVA